MRPKPDAWTSQRGIYLESEAKRPRPYQLVPLLMALRLDPVRLLIADDVGIGKTIEGVLVSWHARAREAPPTESGENR